ncbi:MAG: hypothetical protein E7268_09030 [Lachnospiraceae bacterium]|nr:hypothetical protein [Lachnospiraceae bacterium]
MHKKIVLLLLGMTRAGKTSKVSALSKVPGLISRVCIRANATTPVTTDWELSAIAQDVKLTKIELNPKLVYKSTYSRTVEKYNESLDENPFLTKILKLQKIDPEAKIADPADYVKGQLEEFVNNATFETIEQLMREKSTGDYIRRMTIEVPASDAFVEELKKYQLESVVLRDTRGIMDVRPEELDKMPTKSMYDLGLDKVDAVLLMCSSNSFPVQAGEWYKKIYSECFKAVPVFLEARHDALWSTFQIFSELLPMPEEEYLQKARKGELKGFDKVQTTHFSHGLDLLATYGAVSKRSGCRKFVYNIFPLDECLFLTPLVSSLADVSSNGQIKEEIFNNDEYRFFQSTSLSNMNHILGLVKEHLDMLDAIYNNHIVDHLISDYMREFFDTKVVRMFPQYTTIERREVCRDIKTTMDFLGPRKGITTQDHGAPKYLAAATAATTSHMVLSILVNKFTLPEKFEDDDGNEIAPHIAKYNKESLVRMYLNKKVRDSTDIYAYFRDYTITDRNIVVDAMITAREKNAYATGKDALTVIVGEIAKEIFK